MASEGSDKKIPRMKVEIRLYHGLNRFLPAGSDGFSCRLEIAAGSTVADVFKRLGIPPEENLLIFVGGQLVTQTHILQTEDVLAAMLPAGGG